METATANLSITVNGTLTITTASVPTAASARNTMPRSARAAAYSLTAGISPAEACRRGSIMATIKQPEHIRTADHNGSYPFTVQVTDNQGTRPAKVTPSSSARSRWLYDFRHVSYSGSKTGWTYLELSSSNCNGCKTSAPASPKPLSPRRELSPFMASRLAPTLCSVHG